MISDSDVVWLEARWRQTRRTIVNLGLDTAGPVLAQMNAQDPNWGEIVEAMAAGADARRRAAPEPLDELYALVLSLLGDPAGLTQALEEGRSFVAAADSPEAALRTVLARGAERLKTGFKPHEAHRAKVWRRLDRISRDLIAEAAGLAADRCQSEHFVEVAERVAARHPDDQNLPRRLSTVRAYFFAYCPDCRAAQETPEAPLDSYAPGPGQADFHAYDAAGLPQHERMAAFLQECLAVLPEDHRAAVLSTVGEGRSRGQAMASLKLGRTAFATLITRLQAQLAACIEDKSKWLGDGPNVAVLRWE